jgi:hypothetical protein
MMSSLFFQNQRCRVVLVVGVVILALVALVARLFPMGAQVSSGEDNVTALCDMLLSTDHTKGNWNTRSHNDSLQCHAVLASQLNSADLRPSERLCLGGSRPLSWLQWTPRKCAFPSDEQLYNAMGESRGLRVKFVGDSIVAQMQLNLQCQLEVAASHGLDHSWQASYLSAPFLFKPDVKAQFWSKHVAHDSVQRLAQMLLMQANWTEWLLSTHADVVLVNTGPWWSTAKLDEMFHNRVDGEQLDRLFAAVVHRTLDTVRTEKSASTAVLFLATLPMHAHCGNDSATHRAAYNWNLIGRRNDYVRDAIANASIDGLHFVDLHRMLTKRDDAHPGAALSPRSHDCAHWCNLLNSPLNDAVRLLTLAIEQAHQQQRRKAVQPEKR